MSSELITLLTAATPISEVRGAIPLAMGVFHFSALKAFSLGSIGNIIPVLPLLLFWKYVSTVLAAHSDTLRRFFQWFLERTRRNDKTIEHLGLIGLAIFVAVPLPGTGVWTATAASFLLGLPLWKSFFAISLGVLGAASIMLSLTAGAISFF